MAEALSTIARSLGWDPRWICPEKNGVLYPPRYVWTIPISVCVDDHTSISFQQAIQRASSDTVIKMSFGRSIGRQAGHRRQPYISLR